MQLPNLGALTLAGPSNSVLDAHLAEPTRRELNYWSDEEKVVNEILNQLHAVNQEESQFPLSPEDEAEATLNDFIQNLENKKMTDENTYNIMVAFFKYVARVRDEPEEQRISRPSEYETFLRVLFDIPEAKLHASNPDGDDTVWKYASRQTGEPAETFLKTYKNQADAEREAAVASPRKKPKR